MVRRQERARSQSHATQCAQDPGHRHGSGSFVKLRFSYCILIKMEWSNIEVVTLNEEFRLLSLKFDGSFIIGPSSNVMKRRQNN